jgi:hypothetical protein
MVGRHGLVLRMSECHHVGGRRRAGQPDSVRTCGSAIIRR